MQQERGRERPAMSMKRSDGHVDACSLRHAHWDAQPWCYRYYVAGKQRCRMTVSMS